MRAVASGEGPLSEERVERRLAAILAADVAGYSRLMGQDEAGTLARLRAHRRELIDPKIAEHKGRIVKTTGDGMLVEFPSVVDAVRCAVAVQRGDGRAQCRRRPRTSGSNSASASISATSSSRATTSTATASTSRRGSKHWPSRAGSASQARVHDQVARQARFCLRGSGRAGAQEHRPAGAGLSRAARQRRGADVRRDLPALPLPDKPSIAVLPFQNMSGDPEQEYFADGMVEEIITALSRIRWLFVIARNSSFTYKGQAVDVKQVGRELGVRYVLEG